MVLPPRFALAHVRRARGPARRLRLEPLRLARRRCRAGAVVGTSSLRRECQLRRAYPQLELRAAARQREHAPRQARRRRLRRDHPRRGRPAAPRVRAIASAPAARARSRCPRSARASSRSNTCADRDDLAAAARALRATRPPRAPHAPSAPWACVVEGSCEVPVGRARHVPGGTRSRIEALHRAARRHAHRARPRRRAARARPRRSGRALGERLLAAAGARSSRRSPGSRVSARAARRTGRGHHAPAARGEAARGRRSPREGATPFVFPGARDRGPGAPTAALDAALRAPRRLRPGDLRERQRRASRGSRRRGAARSLARRALAWRRSARRRRRPCGTPDSRDVISPRERHDSEALLALPRIAVGRRGEISSSSAARAAASACKRSRSRRAAPRVDVRRVLPARASRRRSLRPLLAAWRAARSTR